MISATTSNASAHQFRGTPVNQLRAAWLLTAVLSPLSTLASESLTACVGLESDVERLACYDEAMRPSEQASSPPIDSRNGRPVAASNLYRSEPAASAAERSLLDSRWELDSDSKLGTFRLRAHRPVYLLPAYYATSTNRTPDSPNPDNTVTDELDLSDVEAKFQMSLKTKALENLIGDNGDLWLGYTQSSRWQVYNDDDSRPFRETVYEPEAILAFRTNYELFGWKGRLLGVGLNHQSNGRSLPLSRSWNRVIGQVGFERENWTLVVRPWWRLGEGNRKDDNADILDYMGRGDVQLVHVRGDHQFALMLRPSNVDGDRSLGAAQFDWSFKFIGGLRAHLQLYNGYGESLIDYNHRATYIGFGFSLLDWY